MVVETMDSASASPGPITCIFCLESLDASRNLYYKGTVVSCHVSCLRGAWDAERNCWAGSDLEAALLSVAGGQQCLVELAELKYVLTTGGCPNPRTHSDVIELCGWPGRGYEDGPLGWPGRKGVRQPIPIHVFPDSILCIQNLHKIEISDHPVTELPQHGWRDLNGLVRLSFSGCRLSELPEEVAQISSLEIVVVLQNVLRRLPDGFGRMPRLRMLLATGNRLSQLPEPFAPPLLTTLTLEGNAIQRLPADLLFRCPQLFELRLTGNNMKGGFEGDVASAHLPHEVPPSASLSIAYLQGCRLERLPDSILQPSAETLQYLLLSDNRLVSPLPASLACLTRLKWLYLYGNRLRELPDGLLLGCTSLATCLLEGNPLTTPALDALFCDARRRADKPQRSEALRVLGMDAMQIRRWRACVAQDGDSPSDAEGSGRSAHNPQQGSSLDFQPLPSCVQSGWLVGPAGRWYGKLMPSPQLCRASGDPVLGDFEGDEVPPKNRKGRVLMVAMAASQSEPEWGGELGRLHNNRSYRFALQEYALRRSLRDHAQSAQASQTVSPPAEPELISTLWANFDKPWTNFSDTEEEIHDDFDVLLLVDPHRRWYNDEKSGSAPLDRGIFRDDLTTITAPYGRVCLMGASMGGFAALSCADLADAVLAFGPQIDLRSAPYRPGFDHDALEQANDGLRRAVESRRGSVECHFSTDAHLFQATQLHQSGSFGEESMLKVTKLSHGGLNMSNSLRFVVHPVRGRIARLLEKGGLLLPLLAETLVRLQREIHIECNPHEPCIAEDSNCSTANEWPKWQWPCADGDEIGNREGETDVNVLVGCWHNWTKSLDGGRWQPPALSVLRATPAELRLLAQQAPTPGSWLCNACGSMTAERMARCAGCGSAVLEQLETGVVTVPGGDGPSLRKGDWECNWCQRLELNREIACSKCGQLRCGGAGTIAEDVEGGAVCANTKCRTTRDKLAEEGALLPHPSDGLAYCRGCCRVWDRMMTFRTRQSRGTVTHATHRSGG
eukprot:TRINITY_DN61291_c0_g1_i1.p1 TRINITY_DN61291_c0_g1~~TRINITY_DN61291_c0_g1_i1.p1  ORF type:complete len:1011 (+),score=120.95 TRINITY_DN61291_c0_g1_i1:87-3119(+)